MLAIRAVAAWAVVVGAAGVVAVVAAFPASVPADLRTGVAPHEVTMTTTAMNAGSAAPSPSLDVAATTVATTVTTTTSSTVRATLPPPTLPEVTPPTLPPLTTTTTVPVPPPQHAEPAPSWYWVWNQSNRDLTVTDPDGGEVVVLGPGSAPFGSLRRPGRTDPAAGPITLSTAGDCQQRVPVLAPGGVYELVVHDAPLACGGAGFVYDVVIFVAPVSRVVPTPATAGLVTYWVTNASALTLTITVNHQTHAVAAGATAGPFTVAVGHESFAGSPPGDWVEAVGPECGTLFVRPFFQPGGRYEVVAFTVPQGVCGATAPDNGPSLVLRPVGDGPRLLDNT